MKLKHILFILPLMLTSYAGCKADEVIINPPLPPTPVISKVGYDSTYVSVQSGNQLQDKLFYLLTILQKPDYKGIVEQPEFKSLRDRYATLITKIDGLNSISIADRKDFLISNSESESLKRAFVRAYKSDVLVQNIVKKELLPSGNWELYYAGTADTTFLKLVVNQTVAAIDTIINQYFVGTKSKYPEDGPSDNFGPKNLYTTDYVSSFVNAIKSVSKSDATALYLPIKTALSLLAMNNRDEATRFEPLDLGENKAVIANLKSIVWNNFAYTSLIVLGDSPNTAGDAINLSESAKKRIEYAVDAYKGGLAPIILLTGANVYPYYPPTQYFEAIEMKKFMMQTYAIPENVILIEPCARHTTTNLRNAARLIIRLGIPKNKKSLIITTKTQNDIIVNPTFNTRCNQELGYMPGKLGERIADVRLEFTPNTLSALTINPIDPLDP